MALPVSAREPQAPTSAWHNGTAIVHSCLGGNGFGTGIATVVLPRRGLRGDVLPLSFLLSRTDLLQPTLPREEPAGTVAPGQPTLPAELGSPARSPGSPAPVSPPALWSRDRSIFPCPLLLPQDGPSAGSCSCTASLGGLDGSRSTDPARAFPASLLHRVRALGTVHRDLPPQVMNDRSRVGGKNPSPVPNTGRSAPSPAN